MILKKFLFTENTNINWMELLNPKIPFQLLYCLQVIDSITRDTVTIILIKYITNLIKFDNNEMTNWISKFKLHGGLIHIYNLLISIKLNFKENCNQNIFEILLKIFNFFIIGKFFIYYIIEMKIK